MATVYVDFDGDGDLDKFAPDRKSGNLTYYQNKGGSYIAASNPLQSVIGSLGQNITPTFSDLDLDGDMDAIIQTNNGVLHYAENNGGNLSLNANKKISGTSGHDVIQNLTTGSDIRYGGLGADVFQFSHRSISDYVEDFNANEGDLIYLNADLFGINRHNSNQFSFNNSTGALSFAGSQFATLNNAQGNVTDNIVLGGGPSYVDWDGDGDLDLFVSERSGGGGKRRSYTTSVNYYQNNNGSYIRNTAVKPFASLGVTNDDFTFVDLDLDGDFDAVVGASDGTIRYAENDGNGNLTWVTGSSNPFNELTFTGKTTPTFVDLDGDVHWDLLVEDGNGSLTLYEDYQPAKIGGQQETINILVDGLSSLSNSQSGGSGSDYDVNIPDSLSYVYKGLKSFSKLSGKSIKGLSEGYMALTFGLGITSQIFRRAGNDDLADMFSISDGNFFQIPDWSADVDEDWAWLVDGMEIILQTGGDFAWNKFQSLAQFQGLVTGLFSGDFSALHDGAKTFLSVFAFGDSPESQRVQDILNWWNDEDSNSTPNGTNGDDVFIDINRGNSFGNWLQTLGGHDYIYNVSTPAVDAGTGDDYIENFNSMSIYAGPDQDIIKNGIARLIDAGMGDDILQNISANIINAGVGNDILLNVHATGNGGVKGGEGDDIIVGMSDGVSVEVQGYTASSFNKNNLLAGESGNDFLQGLDGNDTLNGGTGEDTLEGGTGNDHLNGGADTDLLVANLVAQGGTVTLTDAQFVADGLGSDTLVDIEAALIIGTDGNDSVTTTGFSGSVLLEGGAGADTLVAGIGSDLLVGGTGNDVLVGGAGADELSGGEGNDTLTGGAGGDWFIMDALMGTDRILDFNGAEGDKLLIDTEVFGITNASALNDFGMMTSYGTQTHMLFYNGSQIATIVNSDFDINQHIAFSDL